MRANWLKERLTAAKQAAPLWAELAEAVQEVFEAQVEPYIDRLRGMTSAFTMSEEDLDKRINELGAFFYLSERVEKDDWPLALMQRQDEIHLKKTDYPLVSTIAREFSGMQVSWQALYAPKDQEAWPYGSRFATLGQLKDDGENPDDWFLSARGVIRLPLTHLRTSFPDQTTIDQQVTEFEAILARFIEPLIPLHIVYDGTQYYLQYVIKELDEWMTMGMIEVEQTVPPVSEAPEVAKHTTDATQTMPAMTNGHVSKFNARARMDALPLDAWTLDRPLPGARE